MRVYGDKPYLSLIVSFLEGVPECPPQSRCIWYCNGVVPRLTASASPKNLSEMQILRPYPIPTESETLGVEPPTGFSTVPLGNSHPDSSLRSTALTSMTALPSLLLVCTITMGLKDLSDSFISIRISLLERYMKEL